MKALETFSNIQHLSYTKHQHNVEQCRFLVELADVGYTGIQVQTTNVLTLPEYAEKSALEKCKELEEVYFIELNFDIPSNEFGNSIVNIEIGRSMNPVIYYLDIEVEQADSRVMGHKYFNVFNGLNDVLTAIELNTPYMQPIRTLYSEFDLKLDNLMRLSRGRFEINNRFLAFGFSAGSEKGNGVHKVIDNNILVTIDPTEYYIEKGRDLNDTPMLELSIIISYPLRSYKSKVNGTSHVVGKNNDTAIDNIVRIIKEKLTTAGIIEPT